ncbi:MAG TPA: riboflavin synthase [Solirubrobacterales bacterium]|nr:riboflavin synthase [Solirubrobacterales bacterium]
MFTGIIEELGRVETIEASDEGCRLRIRTRLASELSTGDSVAVNGACLTATSTGNGAFEADVMRQTLSLTTLGGLEPEAPVNLELPVRPTDRLGGHVVQGHVDGTATVSETTDDGFAKRLRLELPGDLLPFVVERGSIAIEGVSLTVAALGDSGLEVSLIPETLERTTLGGLEQGDRVNVECDVLARYVRRQLETGSGVSPFWARVLRRRTRGATRSIKEQ